MERRCNLGACTHRRLPLRLGSYPATFPPFNPSASCTALGKDSQTRNSRLHSLSAHVRGLAARTQAYCCVRNLEQARLQWARVNKFQSILSSMLRHLNASHYFLPLFCRVLSRGLHAAACSWPTRAPASRWWLDMSRQQDPHMSAVLVLVHTRQHLA